MKTIVPITVLVLLLSTVQAMPATVVRFSANVDQIRLPPGIDYETLKIKKRITVETPAILFKPPLVIPDVRKADKTQNEEINLLIDYVKINISGTAEQIASFWLPEERSEKLALFKDAAVFAKNREYSKENPGLCVLGIIYQKRTMSVLVSFTDVMALGITMKKIGNRFFLTDHSTNDLDLAVVEAYLKGKR
jgi:hypothetical protein